MIRSLLNWIFNHIKERPTDEQLIAYGRQLEREAQRQPPTMRQRGYEQSAWNSEPERHTDPRQVQSARQRATMREVYPNKGDLVQHVNATERKRFTTGKLDPDTTMLPTPRMHKMTLVEMNDWLL